MSKRFNPDLGAVYELVAHSSWRASRHRFDEESVWAIRAALAAERPLLIRGEAGIGKSQLARAAAQVLGRPFLYHVVNARSEPEDLLYTFDAVSRLAQAQVLGRVAAAGEWEASLAEERFVRPGPLWWAIHWDSARTQALKLRRPTAVGASGDAPAPWEPAKPDGWVSSNGCVLLIDEIDKAESDLPNALLESLGNIGFQVPVLGTSVCSPEGAASPLVIVTTNEERELPAAFLRRCLVLQMSLGGSEAEAEAFLLRRVRDHVAEQIVGDEVCKLALAQLLEDRRQAGIAGGWKPGAAEFLDLVRALAVLHPGDLEQQRAALDKMKDLAFKKNAPAEVG